MDVSVQHVLLPYVRGERWRLRTARLSGTFIELQKYGGLSLNFLKPEIGLQGFPRHNGSDTTTMTTAGTLGLLVYGLIRFPRLSPKTLGTRTYTINLRRCGRVKTFRDLRSCMSIAAFVVQHDNQSYSCDTVRDSGRRLISRDLSSFAVGPSVFTLYATHSSSRYKEYLLNPILELARNTLTDPQILSPVKNTFRGNPQIRRQPIAVLKIRRF